jgi:aminoglycoside phosphotransferase family enzyme/predicted kinase
VVELVPKLSQQMLQALTDPGAYPHDPSAALGIETIQTHISHLYLTRDRVYKLRKAVALPFLSFATPTERNADCLREVSLNRRLAPDVYLGVAPLRRNATGAWEIGPAAEALEARAADSAPHEHVVVMKRLSETNNALHMLGTDVLGAEHVDAVAEMLAKFHAGVGLGTPAPFGAEQWLARHDDVVADTFRVARESGCAELDVVRLDECEKGMRQLFDSHRDDFERRRVVGRAVDGHGDLHLDHVYFLPGAREPIAIDCIEFNDELRQVDVAAELAFFAMDLAYRDRADLGERFLRCYAARRDDFDLYAVIDWHILHRALVRAAVAGIAAMEPEIEPHKRRAAAASANAHLALVEARLRHFAHPALILMCGRVGTGKSTVAETVADTLNGVVISSDRTRKQLAGLRAHDRAQASIDEGIYTKERTQAVQHGLLERAEPILRSGRSAVLDATHSRREWRDLARHFAGERGYPALLIEVRCSDAVALERLARRERDPDRISDAGPELFAESRRRFEAPSEWPPDDQLVVHNDSDAWQEALRADLDPWLRTRIQPRAARRNRPR